MNFVEFEEFKKLDLRVGKITKVEVVEGKDKLYKLELDLGDEKRTLVAGLRPYYKKEELEGKKVVVIANLKPKKIAGIFSQGMLLAADDGKKVSLLTVDKEIKEGSKIR